MSLLVLDQDVSRQMRAQRKARGIDHHDEVWEGVYVMPPIADSVHQELVGGLTAAFYEIIKTAGLGQVFPGINMSDRPTRWTKNYRTPDVVVILNGSTAQNHSTFWTGPIDFVVEIVSRGDRSRRKLPFYSKVGVREVLFVDRNPWRLRIYRHDGKVLALVGDCNVESAKPVESQVLPISFQLVPAEERPALQLTHATVGRNWRA